MSTGVKNDSGKRQWWYMDNFWPDLNQVVEVLEYGDKKYPDPTGANWIKLEQPEKRLKDALMRHFLAYRQGELVDPETKNSHLAHVITNALMLMYFDRQKENKNE